MGGWVVTVGGWYSQNIPPKINSFQRHYPFDFLSREGYLQNLEHCGERSSKSDDFPFTFQLRTRLKLLAKNHTNRKLEAPLCPG